MLSDSEVSQIAERLTWDGSEFHEEVSDSSRYVSDTPVALLYNEDGKVLAWAASHRWRGLQTLEGFTSEECRRRGALKCVASLLVLGGALVKSEQVAVFSPHCIEIALSVGLRRVRLFTLTDGEWIEDS
jgi:hypothetical protein